MNSMLRDALLDALSVLVPVACAGCGLQDRALCRECRAALSPEVRYDRLDDGTPVVSAVQYAGPVRQAILAFKEQGRTDVARALAKPLKAAMRDAAARAPLAGATQLCPVPSSRAAFRRRGYDPVALLVHAAGWRTARALRHTRRHEEQKALGQAERSRNVLNSLAARHSLTGHTFIVVDDIVTTGATLSEAVRAVRAAGGRVPFALTLAFTARIRPIIGSS
jgi:ComF family protein